MKKILSVLVLVVGLCLVADSILNAGAKEGKIRWSHKKTGECKWFPAIGVPGAVGERPGIWTTKIVFRAKQQAEFFVIGDGDTDLDLVVKDSNGNVVAKDIDPPAAEGGGSDLCVCRWVPALDEEYTIIIVNNNKTPNIAQAGCN